MLRSNSECGCEGEGADAPLSKKEVGQVSARWGRGRVTVVSAFGPPDQKDRPSRVAHSQEEG